MEEEDKIVAIKVTLKTREKLKRFGIKGDSYDDVITKMFGYLPAELPEEGAQE